MSTKEVKNILLALNMIGDVFKYPIGNKELTEKVKSLEFKGVIRYDVYLQKWINKTN